MPVLALHGHTLPGFAPGASSFDKLIRRPCIWLLSVFCRPVRALRLHRMETPAGSRVPPRGANSTSIDNLEMHRPKERVDWLELA